MAEPFLLRPWELLNLTDYQIKVMIAGQKRMTDTVSDGKADSPPEVEGTHLGDGDFVDKDAAAAFMRDVSKQVNGM